MRGRVLGSVAVFIGLGPLGQLGIGALASILNPATAVLITASIGIICMFIAFVIYPAMSKPDSLERDTANG
jgi:tellurite resistance protein TehA-like permease